MYRFFKNLFGLWFKLLESEYNSLLFLWIFLLPYFLYSNLWYIGPSYSIVFIFSLLFHTSLSFKLYYFYFFFSCSIFLNLFFKIILLFNYSCLHLPPHHWPPPQPNPPLSLASTPPLVLSMCLLYSCFQKPFPHYPLPPPLWLPSVCS